MASLADVFNDQERTNWLKAWFIIDIAKSGLDNLADNEAQNFHKHIYSQCYFPPDGYAATRSMQDTDFNGVVSFMLNCTRFDSKFSFPITTGKPTHNAACLLYKAREIVKAVRHSSIMKVTDVDLQNYFTTFTSLLSDSQYLSQDSDAQNAVKKLAQLEKDTLLLTTTEMMCSLAAVSTFLKQQLRDVAKDVVDASVNDLRVNTGLCIGSIKAYLVKCKKDFNENADKLTQAFDENADKHMQAFYENADKHMQSFDENADKHTQSFDENADKRTQALDENAEKHTQDYNELTAIRTRKFDEHADKRTQEYDELTDIRKKDFDENADKRLRDINELLGNTIFTETSYKQSCEVLKGILKVFTNSLDPDETPQNVASHLDPNYLLQYWKGKVRQLPIVYFHFHNNPTVLIDVDYMYLRILLGFNGF
ncbi:hypothetical protein DPMN_061185 [Dreissena polymorpha]|uniref:Uncharacterized protein n=1 Tax=Dreissena polymorpha TaxID=45954 RepID=A0A9D4HGW6_DREPO|nr:hypothetical protein DPMN_061185 [Dreissena polymorpha]